MAELQVSSLLWVLLFPPTVHMLIKASELLLVCVCVSYPGCVPASYLLR